MRKKRIAGIYCIENLLNKKKYIGQSVDIYERWSKHQSELRNGNHFNYHLQCCWDKYGDKIFKYYILEICDRKDLDLKEKFYINKFNTLDRNYGYNLTTGGIKKPRLCYESKEKLRKSIVKSFENPKRREIQRQNAFLQCSDPKIKEKISGKNNFMYGKTHTEEARKKISEAKKGKEGTRRNKTPVYCIDLNKRFDDATCASKELSLDSGAILKVCRGERKTCGGYQWKFLI